MFNPIRPNPKHCFWLEMWKSKSSQVGRLEWGEKVGFGSSKWGDSTSFLFPFSILFLVYIFCKYKNFPLIQNSHNGKVSFFGFSKTNGSEGELLVSKRADTTKYLLYIQAYLIFQGVKQLEKSHWKLFRIMCVRGKHHFTYCHFVYVVAKRWSPLAPQG